MSAPGEPEIRLFARSLFTQKVLIANPAQAINTLSSFADFLKEKCFPPMISHEFAERNLGYLLSLIHERCEEWRNLGLRSPLHVLDQRGRLITWPHPKFEEISGREPLASGYCEILEKVRLAGAREFLGFVACYLYGIGCTRIFISDAPGDGGIDVIGTYTKGDLKNVCVFVQAKTSSPDTQLDKGVLLTDYAKFLLLRKTQRWVDYCKSLGASTSISGMGTVFMFMSNVEYKAGLRDAAQGLEVLLRSGRQIADVLARLGNLQKVSEAIEAMRPFEMNLSKNLHSTIERHLRK